MLPEALLEDGRELELDPELELEPALELDPEPVLELELGPEPALAAGFTFGIAPKASVMVDSRLGSGGAVGSTNPSTACAGVVPDAACTLINVFS